MWVSGQTLVAKGLDSFRWCLTNVEAITLVSWFFDQIPKIIEPTADTGASKLIGEGKIKLKNDSQISHFTERAIVFENGSELEADVVVFATG